MANAQTLRKSAPDLLRLTKEAFKFIRDNPVGDEVARNELLARLRSVINEADPPVFDEKMASVQLVMTNMTADALVHAMESLTSSEEEADILRHVYEGLRRTKQRAYLRLDLNPLVLRRVRYVLMHSSSANTDKAFKRLVEEIERNGLSKNPMEILGKMAL